MGRQPAYFCRTCELEFELESPEAQRQHAKSEWHIYNLRCRVAEPGTVVPVPGHAIANPPQDEESDSSSDEDAYEVLRDAQGLSPGPEFIPSQCLFCDVLSESFDANAAHMLRSHSFAVPFQDFLLFDLETLAWHLRLVIHGYHECIFCGSRRSTLEAAQQHMLDKGHCRLDMSGQFASFYDSSIVEPGAAYLVHPDDSSLRLPSGKLLAHRSQGRLATARPSPRRHAPEQAAPLFPESSPAAAAAGPSDALYRSARRASVVALQLSRLSVGDQRGLMHLSVPEQRSALATKKKQLDRAVREERRMLSKVESLGNKALMRHFKSDVPGRLNG